MNLRHRRHAWIQTTPVRL